MPNALTGDYEAVLQIAPRQINGVLGTLHQNEASEDAAIGCCTMRRRALEFRPRLRIVSCSGTGQSYFSGRVRVAGCVTFRLN